MCDSQDCASDAEWIQTTKLQRANRHATNSLMDIAECFKMVELFEFLDICLVSWNPMVWQEARGPSKHGQLNRDEQPRSAGLVGFKTDHLGVGMWVLVLRPEWIHLCWLTQLQRVRQPTMRGSRHDSRYPLPFVHWFHLISFDSRSFQWQQLYNFTTDFWLEDESWHDIMPRKSMLWPPEG